MNVTPTPIGTIYKVYITYRCVRLLRLPIESGIAPLKLLLYSNLGFGLGLGLGFGGEGKGVSSESSSSLDSGKVKSATHYGGLWRIMADYVRSRVRVWTRERC